MNLLKNSIKMFVYYRWRIITFSFTILILKPRASADIDLLFCKKLLII